MEFTQIPQSFAPLGEEALYTLTTDQASEIGVRIAGNDGTLLGAKRFVGVTSATFDAAPYLRRAVRFAPVIGTTGIYTRAERTVTAVVSAEGPNGTKATSATRTFLPTAIAGSAARLLTSLPKERLIAQGECEELTLFTSGACTVTVMARAGDTTTADRFNIPAAGLYLFRLDTSEFPGAASITVDAGVCGIVTYTVIAPQYGACRLAWRSSAGSIEHYTFPVVLSATVEADKRRAYGPDGYLAATTGRKQTTLASAYQAQPMLEGLAGLILSPDVWRVQGDAYTPVDVVTEQAVVRRHGTLSCLEIEIRPKRKDNLPWN